MRQPWSVGRQIAIFGSSKRRATWRASASIAPAVSVVNSTSRVRSNNRVTSLRLAMASEARACAAADRLLAITATTRNAKSAIQFCGSAIVNVPSGGRKKKLSVSIAAIETTIAAQRRPTVAVARTTSRKASETVVGLTSGSHRSSAAAAASADRLATENDQVPQRNSTHEGSVHSAISGRGPSEQLRTSYRLFTAFLRGPAIS